MPLPDAAHAAGGDLYPLQAQFLLDAHGAVAGIGQCVIEHGLLDFGGDAIGVRPLRAGQTVDEAVGPIGLEVAPDLVELLAGVAHHLAGAADVGELRGEFEQRELAACYLVLRGHVGLPIGLEGCLATPSNPPESGMATPPRARPTRAVARLPGRGQLSGQYDLRTLMPTFLGRDGNWNR